MELKNYFAQDTQGNAIPGASCYMYQAGTAIPAVGVVDKAGAPLNNPFSADADALIQFAAPNGIYDLRVTNGDRDYKIRVQCADIEDSVAKGEAITGRFLMPSTTLPTTRDNGSPLQVGDRILIVGAGTALEYLYTDTGWAPNAFDPNYYSAAVGASRIGIATGGTVQDALNGFGTFQADTEANFTNLETTLDEQNIALEALNQANTDLASTALGKGGYKVGRSILQFDTIAQLKTLKGRWDGDRANVTSYNDGYNALAIPMPYGGGDMTWLAASTRTPDNGTCFAVTGEAVGRWVRPRGRKVSVLDFGARLMREADSTAAFIAAAAYVKPYRGTVFIPDGSYQILGSIPTPNFISWVGESTNGTVVGSQLDARAVPCFTNEDPASLAYIKMANFSIRGGTYAVAANVTDSTEHNLFDNMAFALQTQGGYYCNKLMQTSTFIAVQFDHCFSGVTCENFTANLNNFYHCEFTGLQSWAVKFVSSEVNNWWGCRFETGGVNGNVTLVFTDARNANFLGCYFERTHNNLLLESSSDNGILFDGCHFTGALSGTDIIPYVFTSDGVVEFGTNSWYRTSDGPARMHITGDNGGMLGANNGVYSIMSNKQTSFACPAVALTAGGTTQYRCGLFTRTLPGSGLDELQLVMGRAQIMVRSTTTGGVTASYAAEVPFAVEAIASAAMAITVGTPLVAINVGGLTVSLAVEPGPTSTACYLRATVTGVAAGSQGFVQCTVDASSASNLTKQQIRVLLP